MREVVDSLREELRSKDGWSPVSLHEVRHNISAQRDTFRSPPGSCSDNREKKIINCISFTQIHDNCLDDKCNENIKWSEVNLKKKT